MRAFRQPGKLSTLILLAAAGGISPLQAALYTLTANEQLYVSLSNDLIVNNTTVIHGDVGLGGTGTSLQIQNTASITPFSPYTGSVSFSGATTCSGNGCPPATNVAGGLKANISSVTNAVNDYNNLVSTLTAMTGGTNIAITGNQTLSTPGLYNATSFNMAGNITLSGNSTDQYVIRVPGTVNITSGSIVLSGGLKPDNVIFLFDPGTAGQNLNWNSSGSFSGILLGNANVATMSFSNTTNGSGIGRVILTNTSGSIQFSGGGFFGAGGVPEPSTFSLVGLGVAVVVLKLRKARGSPP